ncbi:MAG: hypothetical protein QXI58_00970 [Candidatus Micrarchaeia archaeon]
MHTSLSIVSIEQTKNLTAKTNGLTFQKMRSMAYGIRNLIGLKFMRQIKMIRLNFILHFIMFCLRKVLQIIVDGKYKNDHGNYRQIPIKNGKLEYSRYNSDSLWGSHWNLSQLASWAVIRRFYYKTFIGGYYLVFLNYSMISNNIPSVLLIN